MEIKETKTHVVTEKIVTSIKCDVCGVIHIGKEIPNDWHNFFCQHFDWGNDSVDSIENFDVCSKKCYTNKVKEILLKYKGRHYAEIDGFHINFAKKLFQ